MSFFKFIKSLYIEYKVWGDYMKFKMSNEIARTIERCIKMLIMCLYYGVFMDLIYIIMSAKENRIPRLAIISTIFYATYKIIISLLDEMSK